MTNTEKFLTSLARDVDFRPDPGFSGELTRWEGSQVAVLAFDRDVVLFQTYETCGVGDDADMTSCVEMSVTAPFDELRASLRTLVAQLY